MCVYIHIVEPERSGEEAAVGRFARQDLDMFLRIFMYVYIYIYTYVYMYTCMYVCTHTHTYL